VSLCKACLPALKDEWHHIQHEDNGVFDEVFTIYHSMLNDLPIFFGLELPCFALQISIDKLEKCSLELVKHIFNSDTEALNARILSCIFWGLLKVQSSYIKKNFRVCNC